MYQMKKLLAPKDSKSLIKYHLTFYEVVWRFIFVICAVAGAILFQKITKFHMDPYFAHIDKGQVSDFNWAILVAGCVALVRYLIQLTLHSTFISLLSEKRMKTLEEGKRRANQLCKWFFDIIYYSSTSLWAYYLFIDQPWFPSLLGGQAGCDNFFMNWPQMPKTPYLKAFYMVQTGNHLYSLIHHVFVKYHEPKFYEMALHHTMTLLLLIFSYLSNFTIVGVIVLILHDQSDVFLIISRAYTDFKNRSWALVVGSYVMTYIAWIYSRIYVFPTCVIKGSIDFTAAKKDEYLQETMKYPQYYLVGMMSGLFVMHVYWLIFLSKAAVSMVTKKKDNNGYDS